MGAIYMSWENAMNEAESTMRLHLHVPTAIQGELFPTSDAPVSYTHLTLPTSDLV